VRNDTMLPVSASMPISSSFSVAVITLAFAAVLQPSATHAMPNQSFAHIDLLLLRSGRVIVNEAPRSTLDDI
jgi:hypothetical protein